MDRKDISSTLSEKGYTIIPVSREEYPYIEAEEANNHFAVMDIKILHKNGVKTLKPIRKPFRDAYTASNTDHEGNNNTAGTSKEFYLNRFSWYRWLVNAYETVKSHKKFKEILFIIITAMIVGAIAVTIDANSRNNSINTMFIDRLDRLIRAVEMDWGR